MTSGSVSQGDSDGSAPILCQPLGIHVCVEFDWNMYFTDVGSGATVLSFLTGPRKEWSNSLVKNLQILIRAFHIHSRKSPLTEPCYTTDQ